MNDKPLPNSFVTPEMRVHTVLDYATLVLGSEDVARAWMEGPHHHVQHGLITVTEACRTPEGFGETLVVLHRIREVARR